jgi:hypothetical protein
MEGGAGVVGSTKAPRAPMDLLLWRKVPARSMPFAARGKSPRRPPAALDARGPAGAPGGCVMRSDKYFYLADEYMIAMPVWHKCNSLTIF